tara:strand:+ start:170 stop:586 length:417 start_codon:yes stop_codon:yes gene_type:complete
MTEEEEEEIISRIADENDEEELTLEQEQEITDEIAWLDERFKDANFTVSIPKNELDDLLSEEPQIIIKQTFTCACYGCGNDINNRPPNKYFCITNDNMTQANVIDELIKQNLECDCDHHFLEGFDQETEIQFLLYMGS